jgi:hypothetical protein
MCSTLYLSNAYGRRSMHRCWVHAITAAAVVVDPEMGKELSRKLSETTLNLLKRALPGT